MASMEMENEDEEKEPTIPPVTFQSKPENGGGGEETATEDQETEGRRRRGDRSTKRKCKATLDTEAAAFRAARTATDLHKEKQRRNAVAAWVLTTLVPHDGDEGGENGPKPDQVKKHGTRQEEEKLEEPAAESPLASSESRTSMERLKDEMLEAAEILQSVRKEESSFM